MELRACATKDAPASAGHDERAMLSYSTSSVESITGISRTALRYYEEVGVIEPRRTGTAGYRSYTKSDVGAIIGCTLLRNAGFSVAESAELVMDDGVGCVEFLDATLRSSRELLQWHEAMCAEFERLHDIYARGELLAPRLVAGERTVFFPNQRSVGDDVEGDQTHRALFRSSPISSTAVLFADGMSSEDPALGKWGRSVRERYLPLLSAHDEGFDATDAVAGRESIVLEGGPQAIVSFTMPLEGPAEIDGDRTVRDKLSAFLEHKKLIARTPWLMTDYLTVGKLAYATLRVPVEAHGPLAHARLAKLPHA